MKLSISNIAWDAEKDEQMYEYLEKQGFSGIEIAPTRIFPERPYIFLDEAKIFAEKLKKDYKLAISSMQSIWFGRTESIFSSDTEREILIDYTKQAIDFAAATSCKNLVFGCPKNRNIQSADQYGIALDFFKVLGEYSKRKNTVVSIEPNPEIYHTNFINTTRQAFQLVNDVHSDGFMVNLDFGTIIHNKERLDAVYDNINLINHIHISEPFLEKIEKREEHLRLAEILKAANYNQFVSIEMKNLNDFELLKEKIIYVKEVFE